MLVIDDLDPKTVSALEREGALAPNWRERLRNKADKERQLEDRNRQVRDYYRELKTRGQKSKDAIGQTADVFSLSEKLTEAIVYGGEGKAP